LATVCVMYLFSWGSVSDTIDGRLTKLIECHEKWSVYEEHRTEVTKRVTDVEQLATSLPAAVVAGETERRPHVDRIHVCVSFY